MLKFIYICSWNRLIFLRWLIKIFLKVAEVANPSSILPSKLLWMMALVQKILMEFWGEQIRWQHLNRNYSSRKVFTDWKFRCNKNTSSKSSHSSKKRGRNPNSSHGQTDGSRPTKLRRKERFYRLIDVFLSNFLSQE